MNTRFAVATHLLAFLNAASDRLVTSDEVAASVNTHPALLRRLLSMLRNAGIVETQTGPGGGARLARPPTEISLLAVYEAVGKEHDLFALARLSPNPNCPMGARIRATLECVLTGPQDALRQALARVSIHDVCARAAAESTDATMRQNLAPADAAHGESG